MKREFKVVQHWEADRRCPMYYTLHQKFLFFFYRIGPEFNTWEEVCDVLYELGYMDEEGNPVR